MRRKLPIPYEETTILSLQNMSNGTKFQLISQIKSVDKNTISITDGNEEFTFEVDQKMLFDLKADEIVNIFGVKIETDYDIIRIIRSNLDWNLYKNTREIESK
ncbi:MAG: hypothetical protein ACW964_10585 [Candidatus Hodarchaeales archaeon]|jgi:hypothetical protein